MLNYVTLLQYEKKRYYVDPAQANLSSIKQQLTGGSTGSADSHGSHKLHSSALIGDHTCLAPVYHVPRVQAPR